MSCKYIYSPISKKDDFYKNVKLDYDHIFDSDLYQSYKNDNHIPNIYQNIYEYMKNFNVNDKIITLSSDNSISSATIAALNEKYMIRNEDLFTSNLRIIYITPVPFLNTNFNNYNYHDNTVSSLLGISNSFLTDHKLLVKPDQIIYLGLNTNYISNDQLMLLDQLEIKYFSIDRIKKLGLTKIFKYILKQFNGHPIHLSVNLSVFHKDIAPAVNYPFEKFDNTQGFSMQEYHDILVNLKNKVQTIDITGFDVKNSDSNLQLTNKSIRLLLVEIMNIKEKKLNIFTYSFIRYGFLRRILLVI